MNLGLIDGFLEMITSGNTPMRIIFFGGVLLGSIFMMTLAKLFGVTTHVGDDTDLAGVLVIAGGLMLGFALSYSIVHVAGMIKQRRSERNRS
jgi:hypothetical protein